MKIQLNTDKHIDGNEALTAHVEATINNGLRRFEERLTRVEVHLSDENAGKSGSDDKRCMIEARPKNHQPVAATHQAGSVHQAIDGAVSKLKAVLESSLGRLDNQNRYAAPVVSDES